MFRLHRKLSQLVPIGFLWRLTILNILVMVTVIAISGWTIYNTACFLAAEVGNLDTSRQQLFNNTLLNYLWIFMMMAAVIGSIIHFYLIRRFIKPIRSLIESTKELKRGHYPAPVKVYKNDEIGQLARQYNGLIEQLKTNEEQRKRLVTDVSHEIRTPLSNLNGYLLALKDGAIDGEQDLFASLYDESNRLAQMVEQLDQLKEWDYQSAQSMVEKETQDIKSLLSQSVAMVERTLEQESIPLELDVASFEIHLDIPGIQQVVGNLLENAIRYYEGEGPIVLTGEERLNDYLISVSGPSTPIPESKKEKVFKRFYRLDCSRSRMTGGTGLGLAISKEIIERHHQGSIGVQTTETNNIFWVLLPKR